jgi:lysozyme family protein
VANFNMAVALTLKNEGGYVDNLSDPGGATNMGVLQRDLPNIPIQTLTAAQAMIFYEIIFWKPLYDEIEDQFVANKLFDMGVLFGMGTAVQMLQGILKLAVDGVFGPQTLAAVNGADSFSLLVAYKTVLVQHAINIGAEHPEEREFVVGWMRRVNS